MARQPIAVARILAAEYGDVLEPANYVRGVALSGRLRLFALAPDGADPAPAIAALVAPSVEAAAFDRVGAADGAVHSAYVWADELSEATGDPRYGQFLERLADLYLDRRADGLPEPVDPDARVEDIFFASALFGRAYRMTTRPAYADALFAFLGRVDPQAESGLWLHCGASPFTWGRGNAFAALGVAEALSYLPTDDARREPLEVKHRRHLDALVAHQSAAGAWRQIIDRPDSYEELTATAMIGYTLVRGMRRGWLSRDLEPVAARAWAAADDRIDDHGMVRDSCPGTPPLPTLEDYLTREPIGGHDDRAGSMALWFAVEYAEFLAGAAPDA